MNLVIDDDYGVSLWRHLDKQPLTADDKQRIETVTGLIRDAVFNPEAIPESKKIGRPRGSKNKQPEPLFPPGSTYSGEDEMPVIQGEFK